MLRKILIILGVLGIISLSGCERNTEENAEPRTCEIVSWWTVNGEAEGLHALYERFAAVNPHIELTIGTIAGGSGSNAREVLATRMEGGNPPDSFQLLAGKEMVDAWIKPGLLEPVTYLYKDNNWEEVFSKEIVDQVSFEGEIYAVPLNIHRSNILFYNISIFTEHNIVPPKTLGELMSVCEALAENGVTPIAVGNRNGWGALHLFENVLLANTGIEKYIELWSGESSFMDEEVKKSLEDFIFFIQYINSDHEALSWNQAVEYVGDGTCAMINIGGWGEALLVSKGLKPQVDFGYIVFPGTDGIFSWLVDTFVLPKGAFNRQAALEWLTFCGSKDGQDIFNPIKGSIPVRKDGNRALYDVYLQDMMDDFSSNILVGSVTHGGLVKEEWFNSLKDFAQLLIFGMDTEEAIIKLQELQDRFS